MKFKKTIFIFLVSFLFFNCNTDKKNEYPSTVTQNFMNSCVTNGGNQEMCGCLLDKVQVKYSFEEFSSIEVRMLAGQTPPDFLDFIGKSRAECSKK